MRFKIIYRLKATNKSTPWQDCIRMTFTESEVKYLLNAFRTAIPANEFFAQKVINEPTIMNW